jgi:hypothetical protein
MLIYRYKGITNISIYKTKLIHLPITIKGHLRQIWVVFGCCSGGSFIKKKRCLIILNQILSYNC